MKKMFLFLMVCSVAAFAQESWTPQGGWDEPAAPAETVAPAEPAVEQFAPAETTPAETVAPEAAAPAEQAAAPAEAPAGEQFVFTPTDNSAAAPAAAPVEQQPAFENQPFAATPAKKKRFHAGVFAAATYNDFYGTKFGLDKLGGGNDYTLKTSGADDLAGNFWGIGYNAGLSVMYMFKDYVGLHLEVGGAYRWATGESDVSVILTWKDASLPKERADLSIDYYVKQLRVDAPLLARFALPNVAYLEVGPMASFSIYSKDRAIVEDDYGKSAFRNHDVSDLFELDAAVGLGTTKNIGSKMLDMSLRFVMGITPLNDGDDAPKTWQGQFNVTFWFI